MAVFDLFTPGVPKQIGFIRNIPGFCFRQAQAVSDRWPLTKSFVTSCAKIEALFAGAATLGEKTAAGAAAERFRQRLGQAAGKEESIEMKFAIPDVWSRQLFIALCRRYGLRPYRHPRMHR